MPCYAWSFAQRKCLCVWSRTKRPCQFDLSTIPPPLQVLLGFHVPADDGTGCAWIIVCEESGLLLDVVLVLVSEQALSHGWCGR